MNTVLSISSSKIESCNEVAKYLNALGIECFTVYNTTSNNNKIENGCNITFPNMEKEKLGITWPLLKQRYDLGCSHVSVSYNFSGCVYDYIRESECPSDI